MNLKQDTHIVFKKSDINKYLSEQQKIQLASISSAITNGRLQDGKNQAFYYVCNQDEPYAERVLEIILDGEQSKTDENIVFEAIQRGRYAGVKLSPSEELLIRLAVREYKMRTGK